MFGRECASEMVAGEVERSKTAASVERPGGDISGSEVAEQVKVLHPVAVGEVREAAGGLVPCEVQPPERQRLAPTIQRRSSSLVILLRDKSRASRAAKSLPATVSVLGNTYRITGQIQRLEPPAGAGQHGHVGKGAAQHGIYREVEQLDLAAAPAAGAHR